MDDEPAFECFPSRVLHADRWAGVSRARRSGTIVQAVVRFRRLGGRASLDIFHQIIYADWSAVLDC
jgi:hypothetical protein